MAFVTGSSVFVEGYGSGIVSAVTGGPKDHTFHVILDTRDEETRLLTRIDVPEDRLTEGPLRPIHNAGDRVVYLGRTGTITAMDGNTISLLMDEDPPREGYPRRQLRFTMPIWHLHIHHL